MVKLYTSQQSITPPMRDHIRSISAGVHSALLNLLKGYTVPKKEWTKNIVAAYRIQRRKIASFKQMCNPLTGEIEERVVIDTNNRGDGKILLQNHEVEQCIKMYFTKYKGAGARKLYYIVAKAFCGVTERDIQTFLNRQHVNQQIHPSFKNKQKLKPVTSKEVMNRVQMDIVDMMQNPVEISEDKVYRYVLVILDVFSRMIFLRPLQSKSSTKVASIVMQIFSDVGPPKILQTDQGTEFKGVVEKVMNKLKVKIIHSRPYHPQSQEKVL